MAGPSTALKSSNWRRPAGAPTNRYTLFHPAEIELAEMVHRVLEVTDRVRPARVVVDSLSEMRLLARDPLRYRRQILALKEYFVGRECTVLLLDDRTSEEHDLQLQSIAHAVIRLEQMAFEYGRSRRRLRIIKVRGVAGTEGYHDFRIRSGGLAVFPQLVPATGRVLAGELVTSGIPEIDALMGGGLMPGTCTLFIGPAGVGKSSYAAQYVSASAERTPCAIYLFDERQATLMRRTSALGMDLDGQVAKGRVSVDQIEPGELSPGEFAHRVCARVDRDGSRVVMIDSLNGYLHAIPTGQSPLVRMHELIAYLNERGVDHAAGGGAARDHGDGDAVAGGCELSGRCRGAVPLLRGGADTCARRCRSSRTAPAPTRPRSASWSSGRTGCASVRR